MNYKNFQCQGWGFTKRIEIATEYDVDMGYAAKIGDLFCLAGNSSVYDLFSNGGDWLFVEEVITADGFVYRIKTVEQMIDKHFTLLNANCPPGFTVGRYSHKTPLKVSLDKYLEGKTLID